MSEGERPSILICVDNSETQNRLADLLSNIADLTFASDIDKAIDISRKVKIDFAFVSLNLPSGYSYRFVKELRNHNIHYPAALVIPSYSEDLTILANRLGYITVFSEPLNASVFQIQARSILKTIGH